MIRVDIDSLILHRAEQIKRAENILQPGAQDRSFTKKGSRAVWCGAIGQAVFERLLEEEGIPFQVNSVITHDYQVPAGRLEVKTKERSVVPQPYHEASLYEYNQAWQRADWYGFVSLKFAPGYNVFSDPALEKYEAGFVMGCIQHKRFFEIFHLVKKGADLGNGKIADDDTLNVHHQELESIEALKGGEND